MGGPYIPLEMVYKLLERLLKEDKFFGRIELECENSQIFRISKHETMKRPDVDRVLAD